VSEANQNEHMVKFLIWSKKRGGEWYRTDSRGYVDNPDIAGRFTEEEARAVAAASHGDCVAYHESERFVARKRNEYLDTKRRAIRGCLQTMTPQQIIDTMPVLINERIELLIRGGI
jgi:hypothetical protein